MFLSGTYHHTIDGKNRLAVPAIFRKEFDRTGIEKLLVAKAVRVQGPENRSWYCLQIVPRSIYEASVDCMAQAGKVKHTALEFQAIDEIFADVGQMEIDAQGRILIPDEFMLRPNAEDGVFGKRILGTDVAVCGGGDMITIWNMDEHREYRKFRQHKDVAA